MRLKRAGLITYEAGSIAVADLGSRLAERLTPREERSPTLVLSDQQKVILQAVAEKPLSVEELQLRCFRELGRQQGSPRAVVKALRQLRERGLAEPAGHGPLLRWGATAKGEEQVKRLFLE
jgi:DNA-binding transcriptional ArsR family regulator